MITSRPNLKPLCSVAGVIETLNNRLYRLPGRALARSLQLTGLLLAGACATPFLGPGDFSGSFDKGPASAPLFGGKSTYNGAVIFTNLKRADVAAALPADLKLADNVSNHPSKHPVILIISHHDNMNWLFPGPDPPYINSYEELILLIPFVRHQTGSKWHTLVERMYLNDLLAITSGNFYYGYRKLWGNFVRTDNNQVPVFFEARHGGELKFAAHISPLGNWQASSAATSNMANLTAMQEIFSMPILGRDPGGLPLMKYICSYFQWDFSAASVHRIKSRHKFENPFTLASSPWVALGELKSVRNGSWAIKGMEFRVRFPAFPCQF